MLKFSENASCKTSPMMGWNQENHSTNDTGEILLMSFPMVNIHGMKIFYTFDDFIYIYWEQFRTLHKSFHAKS